MENQKENSLQKFTVSELLELKEIQIEDFNKLSKDEQTELFQIFVEKLNTKGVQKDKILKQMWNVLNDNQKNNVWEFNHEKILCELHNYLNEEGKMPMIRDLVHLTDLSRQTIHKHLKEYKESILFNDFKEQYRLLHTKVLDVIYKASMQGDIKACKLFLESTGQMIKANTYIDKQQNNHHTENNNLTPEMISEIIDKLETDY